MGSALDLTGKTFGRLTVVRLEPKEKGRRRWRCLCSCGNEVTVISYQLTGNKTRSCGCYHKERVSKMFRKHGKSNNPTYKSWQAMKNRCGNPKASDYPYYGGRGIKYDPRWEEFEAFLSDMGEKPTPKHTIERINNDGNYTKQNCYWATRLEQAQNQTHSARIEYRGEEHTFMELSRRTGVKESMLRYRIRVMGMSPEEAVETPNRYSNKPDPHYTSL